MVAAEAAWLATDGAVHVLGCEGWQERLSQRLATMAIELRPPEALIEDAVIEPE